MNIGNEKIAVVIFLHFQKATHSTEIISEVQISGWPDSTNNKLFGHDFQFSSTGSKNTLTIFNSQEMWEKFKVSGIKFHVEKTLCSLWLKIFTTSAIHFPSIPL
jgi:hypothetical protein